MRAASSTSLLTFASLLVSCRAGRPHERTASVHLFSPSSWASTSNAHSSQGAAATLSAYTPSDANALMSSFLRIEEYEVLRHGLEVPEQLAMRPFEDADASTGSSNAAAPLLILAEDVGTSTHADSGEKTASLFASMLSQDQAGVFSSRLLHSFEVSAAPSMQAWRELLQTYQSRIAEKFRLSLHAVLSHEGLDKRMMLPPVPGSLNGDMALGAELNDEVYAQYLRSIQSLVALQDSTSDYKGVPVVELRGLRDIARKFGMQSEEMQKAREMLALTTESAISTYPGRVLLITLPVRHTHGSHKQIRSSGAASSSSVFSTRDIKHSYRKRDLMSSLAAAMPIVPTAGQCYDTQDSCANVTSSCFGHGSCVQGQKVGAATEGECWVCQCAATKAENGQTEYWSGAMCQKKDVSSPFFLIVGSVFLLVFISAASVALLAGIGSEPLPSTLAAMGGGSGHRKHD